MMQEEMEMNDVLELEQVCFPEYHFPGSKEFNM